MDEPGSLPPVSGAGGKRPGSVDPANGLGQLERVIDTLRAIPAGVPIALAMTNTAVDLISRLSAGTLPVRIWPMPPALCQAHSRGPPW